jgi:hypothetical protein
MTREIAGLTVLTTSYIEGDASLVLYEDLFFQSRYHSQV